MLALHEFTVGSLVQMYYRFPSGSICLETSIIEPISKEEKNVALCNYLTYEGKVIRCSEGLHYADVHNKEDGRIYRFYSIKAVNLNKVGMLLLSSIKVEPINYREAFRYDCGYDCDVRLKSHAGVQSGVVHDVSFTGIGCTIPKEGTRPVVGETASVNIPDPVTRIVHRAEGNVVRIDNEYSDDKLLIGIKIDKEESIRQLVQNLQRKALRTRDKR